MTTQNRPRKISRRKALAGIAAAGGIAAGAAATGYGISRVLRDDEEIVDEPDLVSVFIREPVPATDPDSGLWGQARSQRIALEGQNVIMPLKPEASMATVRARSLHDGETIAFLLEWDDSEKNDLTIKMEQFRDAAGVMLGAYPPSAVLWMMGTEDQPVTILHWKADWQLDMDEGFQDLEVAFPNVSVDFYPPLVGVEHPVQLPEGYPEDTRKWLPGWHVGNPLSQPVKQTCVEKLVGIGPGTLEPMSTQDATGRGVWSDGKWRVVLTKPMSATDEKETAVEPGQMYALALTVWAGSDDDRGARKSLTKLGRLTVEASS
jgi:hypothetical protein